MTSYLHTIGLVLFLFINVSCGQNQSLSSDTYNAHGKTIRTRINPPAGYKRINVLEGSFAAYLRNIKLKPDGARVAYYDGTTKDNRNVYVAVCDLDIGEKDLHQCADAVMRLRAEYLWYTKQYDQIHFNFTNGFKVDYREWMLGRRMIVKGNKTEWNNRSNPSNTYTDFWKYMELIFAYAGTASLERELRSVPMREMKIGDILIQGGHPGHAVIVMDMAIDSESNQKIYLLAQSYMPAQDLQILVNPKSKIGSPWYALEKETIYTPEWTFKSNDLKRFHYE